MDQAPAVGDLLLLDSPPNESENAGPSICLGHGHQSELAETSSSSPPPLLDSKENIPINNVALPVIPTLYPTLFPVHIPFWPSPVKEEELAENHEVLKPIPVLCKYHANADELVGMPYLSIGEGVARRMEPSALSIKLLESSTSRQSAFHRNPSVPRPSLSQNGSNIIHAV